MPASPLLRHLLSASLVWLGSACLPTPAQAADWCLATADTQLDLSVSNDTLYVSGLRNPARGWNWTRHRWRSRSWGRPPWAA